MNYKGSVVPIKDFVLWEQQTIFGAEASLAPVAPPLLDSSCSEM